MSNFNLQELKSEQSNKNRYRRRIAHLTGKGMYVGSIETVVEESISNLNKGVKSFVVYGEPQSGKTEMMIALTGRLLDEGYKIVIILLNDSVQLLGQNLKRFHKSKIDPAPKNFTEILPPNIEIGNKELIIFCKKNANNLKKLINKLGNHGGRVIIDDEADYATPNSKVNKDNEQSKINELTEKLIGNDGVYIGVTATPARLDLNRTHQNENEHWVDFEPHPLYTGRQTFFPSDFEFPYSLVALPEEHDNPVYLRKALFSFMVNVAYLNTQENSTDGEDSYSMLIHTSGKKVDHSVDQDQIVKFFKALGDENESKHEQYYREINEIAESRFPDAARDILIYILENNSRHNIIVMNSDSEANTAEYELATSPETPFTVIIGGNIVSRGVTFDNLLSMFFTRDVKHKLQQDTYIQRARMFGTRGKFLQHFELTIPKNLFLDWHKCFVFHQLSLQSRRKENKSPVWLEDKRVSAAASSSIDKTTVDVDSGEMSFEMFDYTEEDIKDVMSHDTNLGKLKALNKLLGEECFPSYLIEYVENFLPAQDSSIAFHESTDISGYKKNDKTDPDNIRRARGFIGTSEMNLKKYPSAVHHVKIFFNDKGKARVFYKYHGNIRFIKTNVKKV